MGRMVIHYKSIYNTTELYTQKEFRWEILCYAYFATIKRLETYLMTQKVENKRIARDIPYLV